jgi:hypothetical protein
MEHDDLMDAPDAEHINTFSNPIGDYEPALGDVMTEAPASVNFHLYFRGVRQQFTMRDVDEFILWQRMVQFLDYIEGEGAIIGESQSNGSATPMRKQTMTPNNVANPPPSDESWCAVHQVEMPPRTNRKDGTVFYSHQMENEKWCNPSYRKKILGD